MSSTIRRMAVLSLVSLIATAMTADARGRRQGTSPDQFVLQVTQDAGQIRIDGSYQNLAFPSADLDAELKLMVDDVEVARAPLDSMDSGHVAAVLALPKSAAAQTIRIAVDGSKRTADKRGRITVEAYHAELVQQAFLPAS